MAVISDPSTLALIFGALMLAGLVKGTIGFGLPLVAVSISTLFLSKDWALAIMVLPIALSNLVLGFEGRRFIPSLRRFWPVVLALCTGLIVGAQLLSAMPQHVFLLVLGAVVILFALAEQLRFVLPVPASHERAVGVAAGITGGLLGSISTAYGPPVIMYLAALRLDKAEFVAAIGAILSVASIALIVAFSQAGILVGERFAWSLAACLPVGIGLLLGKRLRGRIAPEPFRRVVTIALFVLGFNLIRRGIA
ncbi:MAG: sulfite exporter TauE/SafE family protein [Gammaproteobacteria bacterium]|nr:sulfite exporter TauE/SafE family protein [Gammaproteobacteria bacterium]